MTNAFNLSQLANNTNSSGQVTLTTGVAGTLPVANGGTGAATLTANNLLVGAGTSAVTGIAAGASGQVLTSNGTTWASAAPPASGGFSTREIITTTNANWAVPAGKTTVQVWVLGGGGGGASNANSASVAGGGSGTTQFSQTGFPANGYVQGGSAAMPNVSGSAVNRTFGGGNPGGGAATVAGCGGGGQYKTSSGGGGGISYAYISGLTPGTIIPVTVGAGGAGGVSKGAGQAGGTSSFGGYASATGGAGGPAGGAGNLSSPGGAGFKGYVMIDY